MAGHGSIVQSPDGSFKEIISHDIKHALADWVGNTAMLYAALSAGLPQRIMNTSDGAGMQAAKTAAVFEAIILAKQALARAGLQLPANMYGGGTASIY